MGCDSTATGKLLVSYVKWDCRGRGDELCLSLLVQTPCDAPAVLVPPCLMDLLRSAQPVCTWGCRAINRSLIHGAVLLASIFPFLKKHPSPASAGKWQDATLYLRTPHGVGTQRECSCPLQNPTLKCQVD